MNKVTKGALAAAAGAAILVGGAGTMAAWQSNAGNTGSTTVTAGSLDVKQIGGGTWTWADGTTALPANARLVPGDVIKYTADYQVTVDGTNLSADLVANVGGVSGELKNYLKTSTSGGGTQQNVTTGPHKVTTTITFDPTEAGANGGMNKQASLENATVTLTQKLP